MVRRLTILSIALLAIAAAGAGCRRDRTEPQPPAQPPLGGFGLMTWGAPVPDGDNWQLVRQDGPLRIYAPQATPVIGPGAPLRQALYHFVDNRFVGVQLIADTPHPRLLAEALGAAYGPWDSEKLGAFVWQRSDGTITVARGPAGLAEARIFRAEPAEPQAP